MSLRFTTAELEAYLEEALAPDEMATIEKAVRAQPELARHLAEINGRRDAGLHSLGEIWRRHRVSCPTREQLGSHLLGVLGEDHSRYIAFHIEVVGCRLCRANLEDLQHHQEESAELTDSRRKKYFQSSAGYLRRKK
jgi:hypothetical protein